MTIQQISEYLSHQSVPKPWHWDKRVAFILRPIDALAEQVDYVAYLVRPRDGEIPPCQYAAQFHMTEAYTPERLDSMMLDGIMDGEKFLKELRGKDKFYAEPN